MNFDPNKLTAFALGELSGPEAREAESWIAAHPEAKRYVEEIRALGVSLKKDLSREPLPSAKEIAAVRKSWRAPQYAAALLVLLLLLYPLRKKLSYAPRSDQGTEEVSENMPVESVVAFVESVAARPTAPETVRSCRFQLPQAESADERGILNSSVVEGIGRFQLQNLYRDHLQSLRILVGMVANGSFASQPGDEIQNDENFRSIVRRPNPGTVSVYRVSNAALSYYCWVQVKLESALPAQGSEKLQPPLYDLALKIARSVTAL